jgi:hypothetical protein
MKAIAVNTLRPLPQRPIKPSAAPAASKPGQTRGWIARWYEHHLEALSVYR